MVLARALALALAVVRAVGRVVARAMVRAVAVARARARAVALVVVVMVVLGWEFRFLVPISGTPIVSGILIPFSIPKIPVGIFFKIPMSGESENWNSDLRYSEFR